MLSPGQTVILTIEKPAAGGRMIARIDGQIVLVTGAIPGERVTARIERVGKGVAYAVTTSVDAPSSDRREPFTDPLCGGCLYAHIAYPRQLEIKSQVIADAFGRIGRLPLPALPSVAASPAEGYRMRARLHFRGGGAGFFREGTHEICEARTTRQLLPATHDVIDRLVAGLHSLGCDAVQELEVSENIEASQRVVHFDVASPIDPRSLVAVARTEGLTGLTVSRVPVRLKPDTTGDPSEIIGGDPYVTDVLSIENHPVTLRRHVLAFFQGNRYLLRDLVAHVTGQIDQGSSVVDLYAGVGVFAISAAVSRGASVIAVEGDRLAAQDLDENAKWSAGAVETVHQAVETFTARSQPSPDVLIVDPPRTGMSKEALEGATRLRARRITYISCDVATLARDARRFVDAGYRIAQVEAFDLFPNTPHVETVVRLDM